MFSIYAFVVDIKVSMLDYKDLFCINVPRNNAYSTQLLPIETPRS